MPPPPRLTRKGERWMWEVLEETASQGTLVKLPLRSWASGTRRRRSEFRNPRIRSIGVICVDLMRLSKPGNSYVRMPCWNSINSNNEAVVKHMCSLFIFCLISVTFQSVWSGCVVIATRLYFSHLFSLVMQYISAIHDHLISLRV